VTFEPIRVSITVMSATLISLAARALPAQNPSLSGDVAVRGRVVTGDQRPISDVIVNRQGTLRSARTGEDGRFTLVVPRTRGWIVARRIGYASDSVLIDWSATTDTAVVLVLRAAPQALRAISVAGERNPLEGATVTPATMRNVPPLGEADVFRTLVLLPGVSQPNDLQGQIHLAGASADETGVRINGHPLQQPFHVFGALGAFNIASLDEATVRMHRLPIEVDGNLGGVVDLRTRRRRADFNREADVSIASGSATFVGGLPLGTEFLGSTRVTYLNHLASAINFGGGGGEQPTLLGFMDGLATLRTAPRGIGTLELIGFGSNDRRGTGSGHEEHPLSWGESLVGATFTKTMREWTLVARGDQNIAFASHTPAAPYQAIDYLDISQQLRELEVRIERTATRWGTVIGIVEEQRVYRHVWRAPGATNALLTTRTPANVNTRTTFSATSAFAQVTGIAGALRGMVGTRALMRRGKTFIAPRANLDWELTPSLRVGAALERRLQNTTYLEEPKEGSILQPSYILDDPKRADVASLGISWRDSREGNRAHADAASPRLLDVTLFARSFPDRPILRDDPRAYFWAQVPLPPDFPRFDRVRARATGATISVVEPLPFRSTTQVAYTWQHVTERIAGVRAPAPWDAPHSLTAFLALPLGARWTASAVMQVHSGVAVTPIETRVFAPRRGIDGFVLDARYIEGARNSARLPGYQRLDLALRRTWSRPNGVRWSAVAQVVNAYGRDNVMAYDWSQYFCYRSGGCRAPGAAQRGLPAIPSVGIEVQW
jgi:hypothetical protein